MSPYTTWSSRSGSRKGSGRGIGQSPRPRHGCPGVGADLRLTGVGPGDGSWSSVVPRLSARVHGGCRYLSCGGDRLSLEKTGNAT